MQASTKAASPRTGARRSATERAVPRGERAHALAFVEWNVYRRRADEYKGPPEFFYACRKPRLIDHVGHGGTLWVITARTVKGRRRYSLAYKLVSCVARQPDDVKRKHYGAYMVQSTDWRSCRYYSFRHDATDFLCRLRFRANRPTTGPSSNFGMRLQGLPLLVEDDIRMLEDYEEQLLSKRRVFISYAREDEAYAAILEAELARRNVVPWIDNSGLRVGDDWRAVLKRIASNTHCFIFLVSRWADESAWVRREVTWALDARRKTGLVKRIVPIILPRGAPYLSDLCGHLQYRRWRKHALFFNRLADEIRAGTRVPG